MSLRRLTTHSLQFIIAPALILWMAGVGCILGCEGPSRSARSSELGTVSGVESCPAHHAHDCCAVKSGPRDATLVTDAFSIFPVLPLGSSVSNCQLALNASAVVSKAQKLEPSIEQNPLTFHSSVVLKSTVKDKSALSIRNRGGTYLLCCVFLI